MEIFGLSQPYFNQIKSNFATEQGKEKTDSIKGSVDIKYKRAMWQPHINSWNIVGYSAMLYLAQENLADSEPVTIPWQLHTVTITTTHSEPVIIPHMATRTNDSLP